MENKQNDLKTNENSINNKNRDKKKIKKFSEIVALVVLFLVLVLAVSPLVTSLFFKQDDTRYNPYMFFEADYSKNIFEDELYLTKNRKIYYDRYGSETVINSENSVNIAPAAVFFVDYFACIINGEYENYPSFFTEEFFEGDYEISEEFTMQALYDIKVKLYEVSSKTVSGKEITSEIYEVSYRIHENNGTFRTDILPDETRTLVYELYIIDGTVKINSIFFRRNAE